MHHSIAYNRKQQQQQSPSNQTNKQANEKGWLTKL